MQLEVPALYLINGPMKVGKSHLIKYIMYQLRKKCDFYVVFSNTFFQDDGFSEYIDKKYIHPEYDEKVLEKLMDIQADRVLKGKPVKQAFVIFDDCLDDPREFSSPVLKRLTTQLRHYNITVIFSTQYCNSIPSRMRANAMAVIIFQIDNELSLKALFQSYGQRFNNFSEFKNYVMENTGDHRFIYYRKNSDEKDITNLYEVLKAPEHIPKFQIKYLNK